MDSNHRYLVYETITYPLSHMADMKASRRIGTLFLMFAIKTKSKQLTAFIYYTHV
jgi:hypothetical protein